MTIVKCKEAYEAGNLFKLDVLLNKGLHQPRDGTNNDHCPMIWQSVMKIWHA